MQSGAMGPDCRLSRIASGRPASVTQRLGDKVEAVLAEVHFLSDKERRRTKSAAAYRLLGVALRPFFNAFIIRQSLEFGGVEAGCAQYVGHHFGLAEVLLLDPQGVEYRRHVGRKLWRIQVTRRAAHQGQGVDR